MASAEFGAGRSEVNTGGRDQVPHDNPQQGEHRYGQNGRCKGKEQKWSEEMEQTFPMESLRAKINNGWKAYSYTETRMKTDNLNI